MAPHLRELIALSLLAGLGFGLALGHGDLLFVAVFGGTIAMTSNATSVTPNRRQAAPENPQEQWLPDRARPARHVSAAGGGGGGFGGLGGGGFGGLGCSMATRKVLVVLMSAFP
jgi:hypothetical protein